MDPIIAGSAIEAGAALVGGALGVSAAKGMSSSDRKLQRELANYGVSMRVADAQRAGVHPLYALGAQLPQFSPVAVNTGQLGEAVASAGASIGRGVREYGTRQERDVRGRIATLQLLEAEQRAQMGMHGVTQARLGVDEIGARISSIEADAAEARSRTLLNVLQINKERFALGGDPLMQDGQEKVLPKVLTGTGEMASNRPDKAWKPFQISADGALLDLPSDQNAGMAQALEGVEGVVPAAMVVQHNLRKYGKDWARRSARALYALGQQYGPGSVPARAFQLLQVYREKGWDAMMRSSLDE